MSDEKLLPCPFCGSPADFTYDEDGNGTGVVECANVRCAASIYDDYFAAVEKWNRRDRLLAEQQERITELEARLEIDDDCLMFDGIGRRDETICCLEKTAATQQQRIAELEDALKTRDKCSYMGPMRDCPTHGDSPRIKELEAELDRERHRLAACGVAAFGYFDGCHDDYKSASLDDVLRLRAERDAANSRAKELEDGLSSVGSLAAGRIDRTLSIVEELEDKCTALEAGHEATKALVKECQAALAEELAAWDIDPPLHHVKQAHDHCEEWLRDALTAAIAEKEKP
jgi:hypothetical protein